MPSLETRVAKIMGYEYCTFFPSARAAIAAYVKEFGPIDIPSNVCPVLQPFARNVFDVDPDTGMAHGVPVQLYGYREIVKGAHLEIDPLMTGAFGAPFAEASIISFGHHKTINLGAGGALLTSSKALRDAVPAWYGLPPIVEEQLGRKLDDLWGYVDAKWLLHRYWDEQLGDILPRILREQIIPWRVMRRVPGGQRHRVVAALRAHGYNAGTNYPPLEGTNTWGDEVINLWGCSTDIKGAVSVIEQEVFRD